MKMETVLVVLVLSICSSISTALPTSSEDADDCTTSGFATWMSCQSKFPEYISSMSIPISLDMDRFCVDIQDYSNCLREKTTACPNLLTKRAGWTFTYIQSMITYVCSPAGKVTATETLNSPCNTLVGDIPVMKTVMQPCYTDYFKETRQINHLDTDLATQRHKCSLVQERDECLVSRVSSACGIHAGDFIHNMHSTMTATPGYLLQEIGTNCPPDETENENVMERIFTRGLKDLMNSI